MKVPLSLSLERLGLLVALLFLSAASTLTAQTITTFDVPNSTGTAPQAINVSGQITGFYFDANGSHSFLQQRNGTLTTFDVQLDGQFWPTRASAINVSGEIVGTFFYFMGATRGFLRKTDGTIVPFRAGDEALSPSIAATEPAPRFDCPDGSAAMAINAKGQAHSVKVACMASCGRRSGQVSSSR